jgi:hypothetical protein
MIQGRRLRVEVTHAEARYALADGDPLEIVHHGQPVSRGSALFAERDRVVSPLPADNALGAEIRAVLFQARHPAVVLFGVWRS